MRIRVRFSEDKQFNVSLGVTQNITEYVGGEVYDGAYEVTPRAQEQALLTAEKVMLHDVTIKEIPYREIPNVGGRGMTVKIG